MALKPLHDRVLVKRTESEEKTAGGLIIPDSAKEKPQEAKIIALGTGKKDDDGNAVPFQVTVGDVVLVSKYGGTEVKFDDEIYQLLREDDILGILG